MGNCKLFYVGSTRVRPIVRCISGIITMNLLVGLKNISKTIRKEMVMVRIHESSNHERVDGKDIWYFELIERRPSVSQKVGVRDNSHTFCSR